MNTDRPDPRPDPRRGSGSAAWPAPRPRMDVAADSVPPAPPAAPKTTAPMAAASPMQDERLARLAARRDGADRPSASATSRRPAGTDGGAAIGRDDANRRETQASSRRAHPAGHARASAVALSLATTVGLATYLHETSAASTAIQVTPISGSVASDATVTPAEPTAPAAPAVTAETATAETATAETAAAETATAPTASTTGLADGTYTGDTVTMKWGPVQVAISVTGGQITSVDVLQYPTADHKSVRINEQAVPTLIAETLVAQSADVDTISGATYTTDGYRASLQTAIDNARAAATAG